MRASFLVALSLVLFSSSAWSESKNQNAAPEGDTVCTFGDGQQLSVRYPEVPFEKKTELPHGKVWKPGNQPMYLFSQTDLNLGSTDVAPGAYSLYVIPGEGSWILVVNKGVEKGSPYDSKMDVARFPAETAQLPRSADKLNLYFGRLSPKKCTLRIDYGKERAYADFNQK